MLASILNSGFYYLVQALVLGLLILLVYRGLWKRLAGVSTYLFALLLIDGISRRYVFYHFGVESLQYYYFYWLTDVALTLGAFLLVCAFFHRACAIQEEKLWRFIRLFLVFVFVLVVGISAFSLSRNYDHLFSKFMFEFQQNLYFTCLVLNTLLYILLQQIETADDELGMLVCGMGLQFAGPAASFALKFLAPSNDFTDSLMHFIGPLCTLGMLLTWFYAVARLPKTVRVPASKQFVPAMVAGRNEF
ncbi:MAG TPA: hypothetical protein VGV68_04150 [Terriglobia bacterium]|nr:hypothetical protein [Terriglobia bacterium]